MKDKILEFQKKVSNIRNRKNQSFFYYGATLIIILGMVFFLTSNRFFNRDFLVESTALNEENYIGDISLKVLDREYNTSTGVFEMLLNVDNSNLLNENPIEISILEKEHLKEKIESKLIKVSDEEYVVYARLPVDWSAVSVRVGLTEENNLEDNKREILKIYADRKDTKENNNLKAENESGYKIKFIDLQINNLNENIKKINSELDNKKKLIMNILEDNEKQKENEKYQTEEEIKETESKINQNNTIIDTTKIEIEELIKSLEENKNRIKKLEEKKNDLQKYS
ncbi:hypothetical protein K5V21_12615 [Clostridium sardiniense]|uniref:Uncharacterized protein n=1 Tax=Clostridium sardiniense TaxID=29369 RepID=A0ABS7KZQ5_CLOSR|nr:hypothetical protein [Clostridium sardiniense]MBY0756290.1 hypothetical protein [Clostridium sardiniense]MDQ0458495.1 hypothetical protein [Clostridium sardiniense]